MCVVVGRHTGRDDRIAADRSRNQLDRSGARSIPPSAERAKTARQKTINELGKFWRD
jgi:hypothetical protein